ncbi:amidohydrolase family protein [Mycobacterium botniense]|uniref:Amidohydrolase n=1 Tax=Mycobacterium botniense TaxID=84962 RepID=A0A7I9XVZ1_9MYCO|nr:amidohydrolase family protein [Mycobacterium botniense]GFG73950.1 amidohydrolase [Mycobacterium botniense]
MLIRRGTLLDGRIVDVRVSDRVVDVAETLARRHGEDVLDAGSGTLLPGLHDHHLHLRAAAAALDSLSAGPPTVYTKDQLAQALSDAVPGPDGWIRAVGYHESVAGELNRAALDTLVPDIPVRLQHRSGALWVLNSAALARIGLADHPDGRLRSADHSWSHALPRRDADLAELSRRLTALGVTGVTDATPDLSADDMVALMMAHRHREFRPRPCFLAPAKMILHDDRLDLDALTGWIAQHHRAGRPVAVHCVTVAQLVVTIAALRAAGTNPRDRVEHAAVVPDDNLADLKELGVTVVTQPNFVAERGAQYLREVPGDEQPQLWRLKSLIAAGVPVAGSTDAPFGALDPWAAMRAAVSRETATGTVLGPDERIAPDQALTLFLGHPERPAQPRRIEVGQPGDVCVLAVPPARALTELSADTVAATVIGGELVYRAG